MEGDAETSGMRPRRTQQLDHLVERGSEFTREVVNRFALGQSQAHEQPQNRRITNQPDRYRLLHNLGQLVGAVEREIGYPIDVERVADRRA